ncbi:cytochrome c3 family protein [Rubritalea marina]|uniref:cytochrome c3 family protein n=1 Tax=Rubritalea marina TaxID=361055 RepID=UPI0003658B08|nr:cytochrome c3 family protein [Rubritalea marina]
MNTNLLYKTCIGCAIALIIAALVGGVIYYAPEPDDTHEYSDSPWDPNAPKHPVTINSTPSLPFVDSGRKDQAGNPIGVRCNTCHSSKEPNLTLNNGALLHEFHQGLHYAHGGMNCVSCHNPDDYESLRLANGESIPFSETIQLCAQCHGTQYRSYRDGSHGGMTGYWDLSKGPRQRNTCTDCHSAHAPAYPKVMPVFPPKVREGSKLPSQH